ncbi:hypothetical protein CVAR_0614 [Corynebacterium variabile DSM 44702]|uniref:ClbS/DfsB family four-helix bundle protein n=1 Tax=Corynebacterium variabile (strain DSM 44702 / CIP 107183 / JCM 12073 / NCIMB 30131) TaxID=858619 RepID=G0HD02_CORVD|nr:hypothetical protein CVAR_0614 [Corynebacterium variabile DSM 44702]
MAVRRCEAGSDFAGRGRENAVAVPQSKDELLDAIEDGYIKLVRDLERVPEDQAGEASLSGHKADTMMSPADLVAYLVGWNELVLSWHEQRARGDEPEFPAPGYTWNQLGDLAQQFYRDYADLSWAELLERFDQAKAGITSLIEGLSNEELYGEPWYGKYTAGRMIQFNTSSPYANARRRIRAWLREQGNKTNEHRAS